MNLNGDYLEFGVWKGDTFSIAYYFSPDSKIMKQFRLFVLLDPFILFISVSGF